MEVINGITRLLDAIIGLFSAVFGFLPAWVSLFVGSAMLFTIGVFIVKFVRGA